MKSILILIISLFIVNCSDSKIQLSGEEEPILEDISSQFYLRDFVVDTTDVFLYGMPSLNSAKIQALEIDQPVIFLAMKDNWVKINVKNNGNIGYVNKNQIWPYD